MAFKKIFKVAEKFEKKIKIAFGPGLPDIWMDVNALVKQKNNILKDIQEDVYDEFSEQEKQKMTQYVNYFLNTVNKITTTITNKAYKGKTITLDEAETFKMQLGDNIEAIEDYIPQTYQNSTKRILAQLNKFDPASVVTQETPHPLAGLSRTFETPEVRRVTEKALKRRPAIKQPATTTTTSPGEKGKEMQRIRTVREGLTER